MVYPPQPQQPGYPQPQWPQQPPAYPPQAPPQYPPQIPQQPYQQPAQGYGPPGTPYGQAYQQPAPPPPPPINATLGDFWEQPSTGSGASWTFKDMPPGTQYAGIVARDVTKADIRQQTNPTTQQPVYYRDGRPKLVMVVPMICQPSAQFPDGKADWYVGGQSRDELARAMAEAGLPAEAAPRKGAFITVTLTGRRPSRTPGLNPSNQVQVTYQPAAGDQPAPQPPAPAEGTGHPQMHQYVPQQAEQQQFAQPQAPVPTGKPQYVPAATGPNGYPQQPQQVPTEYANQGPIASTPAAIAQQWAPVQQAANEQAALGGVMVQPDHQAAQPGPWQQAAQFAAGGPVPGQGTQQPQLPNPQQIPGGVPQGQPVQQQLPPSANQLTPEQIALMQSLTNRQQ